MRSTSPHEATFTQDSGPSESGAAMFDLRAKLPRSRSSGGEQRSRREMHRRPLNGAGAGIAHPPPCPPAPRPSPCPGGAKAAKHLGLQINVPDQKLRLLEQELDRHAV
jgi:hypothetical protein